MTLRESLAGLSPKDSDSQLAKIWRDFRGTQYFEALLLLLDEIRTSATAIATNAASSSDAMRHAAGRLHAVLEILQFSNAAATFNPDTAVYNEPLAEALGSEDDSAPFPEDELTTGKLN